MIKNRTDQNNTFPDEPGEEQLAKLIKEAGKTARERKKKTMDNHFKKLRAAIAGTFPPPQKSWSV
jgi:hypothetical protein